MEIRVKGGKLRQAWSRNGLTAVHGKRSAKGDQRRGLIMKIYRRPAEIHFETHRFDLDRVLKFCSAFSASASARQCSHQRRLPVRTRMYWCGTAALPL